MKNLKIGTLLMMVCTSLFFTSCGGVSQGKVTKEVDEYGQTKMTKSINTDNVIINESTSGLKGWFELLQGSGSAIYQDYGKDEDEASFSVEVRLQKLKKYSSYKQGDIYLHVLDKDGNYIVDEDGDKLKLIGVSHEISNFNYLDVNDKTTMNFAYFTPSGYALSKAEAQKFFDATYTIEIYSTATGDNIELNENDDLSEQHSISENKNSTNDWDSLLENYENMAVEYEKLAKEMKSGNLNTNSLAKLATEAAKMQQKFDDSKSELTPKQTQRLTKIAAKIAQAAASAAQGSQDIQSIDGVNLKDLGL